MQIGTIGHGVVDKGPWLADSHNLVILTGGQTARRGVEGIMTTTLGPRLRHIHLLDMDAMGRRKDSMAWSELTPHCLPVAAPGFDLLLWPVIALSYTLKPHIMGHRQECICRLCPHHVWRGPRMRMTWQRAGYFPVAWGYARPCKNIQMALTEICICSV